LERLQKLLFELSSAERMKALLELQKHKLKLSQLSRNLDLTVTETSRHLQRLTDEKLIEKNTTGTYELTQYGKLALQMLEGIDFVSKNRDCFLKYDTSGIPSQFIDRFSELKQSVYKEKAMTNLEEGAQKIQEAQKQVWILSDDILTNTIPVLKDKTKSSFDLRIILPEGKFPPENTSKLPQTTRGIQKRTLTKINILIVMTETYAIFCLPDKTGKIDYTGFAGQTQSFHKWCKELYLYYWEKAKPVS
jgi:predicted transcriptional regulator